MTCQDSSQIQLDSNLPISSLVQFSARGVDTDSEVKEDWLYMYIDVGQLTYPLSSNLLLSNLLFVLTVVGAIDRLEILSGTKCLKGRTKPISEQ